MTTTGERVIAAERIHGLDLEPVVFALMHPDPGLAALDLFQADVTVAMYRSYLTLCAWYPGELLVPSRGIDRAWQAHILDTAKYARDCEWAFGYFLDHFPYLGMRGGQDARTWAEAYARTQSLFFRHWGSRARDQAAPAGNGRICLSPCGTCPAGGDWNCDPTGEAAWPRPHPDRKPATA